MSACPLDTRRVFRCALAGGPPELALVELEGLAEVALGVGLVEVEVGGVLVEAEELDLLAPGGGQQRGVVGVLDDGGDAVW
jgi:hypothetical protein